MQLIVIAKFPLLFYLSLIAWVVIFLVEIIPPVLLLLVQIFILIFNSKVLFRLIGRVILPFAILVLLAHFGIPTKMINYNKTRC